MCIDLGSICADLANVVFPALCRVCGGSVEGGEWAPLLCVRCGEEFPVHDDLVVTHASVSTGFALARFEGPARRLLIDLKYQGVMRAGSLLGRRMARSAAAEVVLDGAELVVPIPLHWWRRWRRGHNQAATLGRAMCAARHGLELTPALRRLRPTAAQVGLDRNERLVNVTDAFGVRARYRVAVSGKIVVLVDDVVTTGSTAASAAAALHRADAKEVRLYAAAWAPRGGS